MKGQVAIFFLLAMLILPAGAAWGLLDQFEGDSAIYSATTAYLRPNVLFIIDNSAGMTQQGSREPYDPNTTYEGDYSTSGVYERKSATSGTINYVPYIADVSSVSCTTANDSLLQNGYYAGKLKKDGTCNTPQTGNYFSGNLLNYISTPTEAAIWQADTAYKVGDLVQPTSPLLDQNDQPIIYRCITAGTSGADVSTWPGTHGTTFTDGTVTWRTLVKTWQASTAYQAGDVVIPTGGGGEYECGQAGTSGATEPTWSATSTTPDNDVQWAPSKSLLDLVKITLKQVIEGARPSVKFGVMVFGGNNHGGAILEPVQKVGPDDPDDPYTPAADDGPTNFSALNSSIDGITLLSGNSQPVNETLWDASLYYQGLNDSSSKLANEKVSYPSPIDYQCQKSFVIILTTGATDTSNPTLRSQVGDLNLDGNQGFVDDAAKYLYERDMDADFSGYQRVQTNVIQLMTPKVQRLEDATSPSNGRGSYFHVNNSEELTEALLKSMANIVNNSDTSFVAPVVPTSPENRTYSGERVYLGLFKPITQRPWHGNLKKYGISSTNAIVDVNDDVATLADGSFSAVAKSYWSTTPDAGAVESGGVGEALVNRLTNTSDSATVKRQIYSDISPSTTTDLTNGVNRFNATNVSAADLGYTIGDGSDDARRDDLINYIYGYDSYDDDGDGNKTEKRDWILGDILHSKPAVVNYNTYVFDKTSEANCSTNTSMIYVGTNDGMLHAFRDCDGGEEWAFIPRSLWPNLQELGKRPALHTYFIDSSPVVYRYDKDGDGNIESADGDKVVLIFGLRRGGDAYYALDVTDRLTPKFLWKIDSSNGFSNLGETWSEPQLTTVKIGTTKTVVAFIGAGYDTEEDGRYGSTFYFPSTPTQNRGEGQVTSQQSVLPFPPSNRPNAKGRGVYVFKVASLDNNGVPAIATTATKIWEFVPSDDSTKANYYLDFAIPSDVTLMDTNFDGLTDRFYVGDLGGRMWRFNVSSSNTADWTGNIIYWDWYRKIFYRPSISIEKELTSNQENQVMVGFGTGDRAHPLNIPAADSGSPTVHYQDKFIMVKDKGQGSSGNIDGKYSFDRSNYNANGTTGNNSELVDVTDNLLQSDSSDATTISDILANLNDTGSYGWYIRMDRLNDNNILAGEKSLASPLIFNKVVYFTSYTPNTVPSSDPCSPGNLGQSRLYAVDYKTGEAVLNFANANSDALYGTNYNNDTQSPTNDRAISKDGKVLRKEDRSVMLGVGIPSGLVVLLPPSGDAQLLIGCGGGLCAQNPVLGGTIYPIYWLKW